MENNLQKGKNVKNKLLMYKSVVKIRLTNKVLRPVQHQTDPTNVKNLNDYWTTTAKIGCFGGYFEYFQSNSVL